MKRIIIILILAASFSCEKSEKNDFFDGIPCFDIIYQEGKTKGHL
jgi:hypothetical protein